MDEILIFGGTTEGRELSESLAASGIAHTLCVATEYGERVLREDPVLTIHRGRLDKEEIRDLIGRGSYAAVVDATHPYAVEVTHNIRAAMQDLAIPYFRLKRENAEGEKGGTVRYFESHADCAKALQLLEGNILLTIGSKELAVYCASEALRERLYVRVLPAAESLRACEEQGIAGRQILALQGPFTAEMNEAMLRQYRIKCLVTKDSGRAGGYEEKLEAAAKAKVPVYVTGRPEEEGDSFERICDRLESVCGKKIGRQQVFEILLAGIGMGEEGCMTGEVRDAIEEADILMGAERMIVDYQPKTAKKPFYRVEQIIPYLERIQGDLRGTRRKKVVILFSGDSGFYSGCQKLYGALREEIETGRLRASVRVMPGISSVAYLAACMGESYDDAAVYSMHGKEVCGLAGKIRESGKTFLLLSGLKDLHRLGSLLLEEELETCTVTVGFALSYPGQRILELTPWECLEQGEEGLYTCLVRNPQPRPKKLTPGKADALFDRGKVPMTKEEVREISICKLGLYDGAVVYDIGSGTGSVAVEIAELSDKVKVFAVERRKEAVELIERNRKKFRLDNIEIVSGEAPEALRYLPPPTHALIGGSGGKMKEILSALYRKNPNMRIVIHAVTVETICEIREVLTLFPVRNEEIVQIQVSRARCVGNYHLMQAENPVWVCAFEFNGQAAERGWLPE